MTGQSVHRPTTASLEQFWRAITIWNEKPHVVNRRLCGALKVICGKLVESDNIKEVTSLLLDIKKALNPLDTIDITATWVVDKLDTAGIKVIELKEDPKHTEPGRYIYVKKLLPRNCDLFEPCLELVIKDTAAKKASFMGLLDSPKAQGLTPSFPFHFQYIEKSDKQKIQLIMNNEGYESSSAVEWMEKCLFNKVVRWAETAVADENKTSLSINPESSLNLINIFSYNQLYQKLKKKYGPEMVKIWPEKTDPQKFVYEDVAIATYLLLLWEDERQKSGLEKKQTFVDLGCGNGLLVHILSSEGHSGIGIDIRKRNIWSIYPETTKLQVQPITPSDDFLYPEADWLIGNHSDELTAWIPIIAARSSYRCKFFLLPCCPYELNGQRYQRMNSSHSQYQDFMHFLQELCKICGFAVSVDRLRIPSTKRTCLVGSERTYPEKDREKIDEIIKDYIKSKVKGKSGTVPENCHSWASFQPRPSTEKVRNCTQLDKVLVEEIITFVTEQLLVKKRLVHVMGSKGQEKVWNAGGRCTISELVSLIPSRKLKKLKNECGGLKTLLKNKSSVFDVKGETVCFKVPTLPSPKTQIANSALKYKEKPCWFQYYHPEGCPLLDEDCTFKH